MDRNHPITSNLERLIGRTNDLDRSVNTMTSAKLPFARGLVNGPGSKSCGLSESRIILVDYGEMTQCRDSMIYARLMRDQWLHLGS